MSYERLNDTILMRFLARCTGLAIKLRSLIGSQLTLPKCWKEFLGMSSTQSCSTLGPDGKFKAYDPNTNAWWMYQNINELQAIKLYKL